MVTKCPTGAKIAILLGFLANSAFSQCESGVCQMRTPVRSAIQNVSQVQPVRSTIRAIAEAQPIRSTLQCARPANWRVFSNGSQSCSGVARSCSGVAQTACYNVAESWTGSQTVVVTESLPVQAEASTASFATAPQPAAASFSERISFRRNFAKAVKQARESGKINRWQALTLNLAARSDKVMNEIQSALTDAAIEDGVATAGAIDWDSLLNFINNIDWEALIKFIEAIMKLFAVQETQSLSSFLAIN